MFLFALGFCAASCSLSLVPTEEDLAHYYREHERQADRKRAELYYQYEAAEITRDEYWSGVNRINGELAVKVNEAAYRDYLLRKSRRQRPQ